MPATQLREGYITFGYDERRGWGTADVQLLEGYLRRMEQRIIVLQDRVQRLEARIAILEQAP